ncbi:MAG: FtsX-like permease family protein, partial [Polyangiales bacterium]
KKLAKRLFKQKRAVGQYVFVNDVPFLVIGVLASKGALTGNTDDDDTLVMPFTSGSKRVFGTPNVSWISVKMDGPEHAAQTVKAIESVLIKAHHIKDFNVFNKVAAVQAETATLNIMTSLLIVTAVISLVVGGIGVMNVMLMTVTERTSEIGIRMAVGASRGDVLSQFLTEAVVLASVGGLLGLVLGWGAGMLGTMLENAQVVFTGGAALLAFCCSVATGLVCGYLPARRAAHLDPVVALARQ